jgi:DNA-binding beta-propeller fold protein YncE
MRLVCGVIALIAAAAAGFAAAAPGRQHATTYVTVHVTEWEFSLSSYSAPVGTVVFTIVNDGEQPHNFAVGGKTSALLTHHEEKTTLTVDFARPGDYPFTSTWDDTDREMYGEFTITGLASTAAATTTPTTTTTSAAAATRSALPLKRVADVPLPGGSSRFDYQSVDARRHRLYIAHLGAGAVIAFDVRRRRVAGNIGDVAGAHGVLAVPALGRIYAAATGTHELVTIRARDGRIVARAAAGSYPDGVAYDPALHEVFVSDETGGAAIVVGARSGRHLAAVQLGGDAGNIQYDPATKRILVDVQSENKLAAIDPKRRRVVARYALPGCSHDHGLHLDAARRLAFVACDENAKLLVFDLRRKRVTASFDVGDDPDVLDFDPSLRRLYVAAESGVVAVFQETGRSLHKLGQALLAPTAHSVAVDPKTHLVYFPLENVNGRPVLRIMRPS